MLVEFRRDNAFELFRKRASFSAGRGARVKKFLSAADYIAYRARANRLKREYPVVKIVVFKQFFNRK